jgi:hypothetical protein
MILPLQITFARWRPRLPSKRGFATSLHACTGSTHTSYVVMSLWSRCRTTHIRELSTIGE